MLVKWNAPTEPFQIIGNVYYVGTAGSSSYLITSPQGHILVDTALPESTPLIKANIEKLGFKVTTSSTCSIRTRISIIPAVSREIKQETGAQLVSGAADKPLLEGGYYPGDENNRHSKFPPVKVDRTVRRATRSRSATSR